MGIRSFCKVGEILRTVRSRAELASQYRILAVLNTVLMVTAQAASVFNCCRNCSDKVEFSELLVFALNKPIYILTYFDSESLDSFARMTDIPCVKRQAAAYAYQQPFLYAVDSQLLICFSPIYSKSIDTALVPCSQAMLF